MDVVVRNTRLIKEAASKGKVIVPGKVMTIHQAAKQFEIYTGRKLPEEFINKKLEVMLNET